MDQKRSDTKQVIEHKIKELEHQLQTLNDTLRILTLNEERRKESNNLIQKGSVVYSITRPYYNGKVMKMSENGKWVYILTESGKTYRKAFHNVRMKL